METKTRTNVGPNQVQQKFREMRKAHVKRLWSDFSRMNEICQQGEAESAPSREGAWWLWLISTLEWATVDASRKDIGPICLKSTVSTEHRDPAWEITVVQVGVIQAPVSRWSVILGWWQQKRHSRCSPGQQGNQDTCFLSRVSPHMSMSWCLSLQSFLLYSQEGGNSWPQNLSKEASSVQFSLSVVSNSLRPH